ncbi:MAG: chromate transporter [Anaerolineae bacterium]|nr:chromate transporter [Anaerolineae bacterium]
MTETTQNGQGHPAEVARLFLKLGVIAFGGPAAHIALMRDEIVRQRGWVTDQHFLDLLGATNLIPGPNSTEMAIHLGYVRAGWRGLVAAGTAFIVPAMLMVMGLAWAYVRYGSLPQAAWLLYGVKPAILAVVAQALWTLGKTAVKGPLTAAIGTAGLALYFLGYNLLPAFERYAQASTILGASAAVMGVFIGIATYRPDLEIRLLILGTIKLKWLALIYVFIDLVSIREGGNSGGHLAHLGGAIYGYLAARQLMKGRDPSLRLVQALEAIGRAFTPRKGPRMKVAKKPVRNVMDRDAGFNAAKRDKQARVDAILDKIGRSGYDSLTKEEKDFLFKASQ